MKETNSRNTVRKDQLINDQRRRLEQLRLQCESENTKLLKIQQREREVEGEYQSKKKDMRETINSLAQEAEQFLKEQDTTTRDFDSQKEQIYSNDRKIKSYRQQAENIRAGNEERLKKIRDKKAVLENRTQELNKLKAQISDYRIYQDFLRDLQQLSEEFSTGDGDEQGVGQIIKRYETLQTKRAELIQQHRKIQAQKDEKIKSIQALRTENQDKILTYNSRIKELKVKIDRLSEQNVALESQIEGRLNENNERLTEIGQIIFSIRNLYESIAGEGSPQKNILEMLTVIRDEKRKLKDIMDLYQKDKK